MASQAPPRLVVLTDTERFPDPAAVLAGLLEHARPGGVLVVLRDRALPVRRRLELGLELATHCRRTSQSFVVAERADLARVLGADGVHLPRTGLEPKQLRKVEGVGWLSAAYHADHELDDADLDALTAVLISPVCFERKGRPPLGAEGFALLLGELLRRQPHLYSYALGGVTPLQVPELLQAGATGVAVIGGGHVADPVPLLSSLDILR